MSLAGMQRIGMVQMAILNLSMRHLAAWLVTQDIDEIRRWPREGVDMLSLIPPEFEVDLKALRLDGTTGGWARRRMVIPALREMGTPHWDELLHLMDDMAQGVIDAQVDPQQVESGEYLQLIVGTFLEPGENHGSSWYYSQMERLRDIMVRKLEATLR